MHGTQADPRDRGATRRTTAQRPLLARSRGLNTAIVLGALATLLLLYGLLILWAVDHWTAAPGHAGPEEKGWR